MKSTVDFNEGWLCRNHGPIEKLKSKTINKKAYMVCPICEMRPIGKWTKPLNERAGRCSNCGHGKFTLHLHNHFMFNKCKRCEQVVNVDKGEIKRTGKGEYKL